ncbi:4Fe-4S binding protein, partial [Escherichia coli]|uniref:4Fe-4S binding protein n=1 Tax=Escherichia coli TaxID=562 RepID=UPI002030D4BC
DWRNASSWRKATQFLLLAINIYIGVTFYYWVRYFETAGTSVYIPRPGGIEGWLPIAGLMNIRYTLETGFLPPIHAASMLLLVAFILISLLLKKAFCSWLCPLGTLYELLGDLEKKVCGHHFNLPRWRDIAQHNLKYLFRRFIMNNAMWIA